jgi:hypothetical protein
MNWLDYLSKVVPEKYRKGNYVPQEFDIAVVEVDETATGIEKFIGTTSPNPNLNLAPQEYVICQLIPRVVKSASGKREIGGDSEVKRLLPQTFFARRDQIDFDDMKNEIARWALANDVEKTKILSKQPGTKKFTRFGGKSTIDAKGNDTGMKNLWLMNELCIKGNIVTFTVPQGFNIITVDAAGNRSLATVQRTDRITGNVIPSDEPMVWYESSVFVRNHILPEVAVRAQLSTLPLVTRVEDYMETGKPEDLDADDITKELENIPADSTVAKTGTK